MLKLVFQKVKIDMIKKIEESFRLPCDEIKNDDCISRALGVDSCTWIFGINKDKELAEALKIADTVLIALLKGNNLDLKSMLEKDGLIKTNIKKEASYRINSCREETKKAIPKLVKKLPEGVVLDAKRIENLTSVFPLQYLSMFEQFSKYKK